MRNTIIPTLAILAVLQSFATPARAQEHGAAAVAAGAQAAEASPILVSILKAGPRTFVTPEGDTLTLGLFNMATSGDGNPMILDSRTGLLLPVSQTGEEGVLSDGKGGSIRLNDHAMRLRWTQGRQVREGAAAAIRNEDVEFAAGERTVHGRITHATGPGPHPLVILVHGAGVDSRDFAFYAHLAGHLAANGVSVLTFDKRGWGETPSNNLALIPLLASDVGAAIRYVRARDDVQAGHVGLIGLSEGGWTAPLAASQTEGVAFLSLIAAPALDTWEQEMDETNDALVSAGASEEDKTLAFAAMREMYRAAGLGGGRSPEMVEFARQLADKPWASKIDFNPFSSNLAALRLGRYDPAPALRRLTMPIQLLYGAEDLVVPYRRNVPVWREHLAAGGASDVTVDVFSRAGHALFIQTGPGHDVNADKQFAPGVLATLTQWVRSRAGLTSPEAAAPDAVTREAVMLEPERYVGDFQNAAGRVIAIRRFGSTLQVNDLASGRTGGLSPEAGSVTDFRLYNQAERSLETLQFRAGGGLIVTDPAGRTPFTRLALRYEDVTFASGGFTMAGTVVLPAGPGPFPAVAFIHGSGPTSRHSFDAWGAYFAAHGIASITYDKRGVGESQGDYQVEGITDLADDLTGAFDVLRARPDIREDAIGILGTSQGGWPAVEVAQRRNVRFIVTSSMGPLGGAEQETFARLNRVRDAGFGAAEQAAAAEALDTYFGYLKSCGRENVAEVSKLYVDHGAEPWFSRLNFRATDPTVGDWPPLRIAFASDLSYRSQEAHAAYPGPMLFLLGGADPLVPTHLVADRVAAAGRSNWTLFMFDGADHGITVPAAGDIRHTAAGYYDRQIEWIQARLAEPVTWTRHEDRATSGFASVCVR